MLDVALDQKHTLERFQGLRKSVAPRLFDSEQSLFLLVFSFPFLLFTLPLGRANLLIPSGYRGEDQSLAEATQLPLNALVSSISPGLPIFGIVS
jgi:hypothetical protein